jgi:glycosyltransferase involved in cell wall biosynthesis
VVERSPSDGSCLDDVTVLVDCRWLGNGGIGRVTELLLADLRAVPPPGTWRLWGDPERVGRFVFRGASIVPWRGDPKRWFGQADLLRVPRNDVAVYVHQIRPFRPGRAIQFVHDTIPIRMEHRRAVRFVRRLFFGLACRMSSRIVTVSAGSKDSIIRDLSVPGSKIAVVSLAVDAARVDRIRAQRRAGTRRDEVVFLGRFAEHKNLYRLCRAFQATEIHRRGGRLLLVGGTHDEVTSMSAWVASRQITGVEVRGVCSDVELDEILAACRALVQPSLAEGYGLPAVEAAAAGVQVAASRAGFAPELPAELVTFLDPLDEKSIADAIDAAVARPDVETAWRPRSTVGEGVLRALTEVVC